MPTGTIGYTTLASTAIDGTNESNWNVVVISKSALRNGSNVLAVEIHQAIRSSSDISFDLQLSGTSTTPITANAIASPQTTFSTTAISPTAEFLASDHQPSVFRKRREPVI